MSHIGHVEGARLPPDLGLKDDLEQEVAQLLEVVVLVPVLDGLQHLLGLLDQLGAEGAVVRLCGPGAAAHAERVLLPAAFVGSAAAAGVHAAMAPSHLQHSALFGAFFVGAALFQISWAAALVFGCPRPVLLAGAAVNTAFIGLWAVTRTFGLPVVLPQPEAVGPWDVSCVAWQLVVVVAILRLIGSEPVPLRLAAWHRWDERVVLFAFGSVALLAALSFSGFSG